jgi:multicomponent K+:H+ antiporter subunit D
MMNAIGWLVPHLVVAPVLIPMLAAGVMIVLGEQRRPIKLMIGVGSTILGLTASIALLVSVNANGPLVYRPGNWPVPFGIALAVDGLSAVMLIVSWVMGMCALVFAAARWHRAGVHFPALLQLQLMGLSGAFVTADIFNLFVFFEILLAASYGLLLHGSGRSRVRASVRYVAINLTASSLFLLGIAIIYGVTGTLNMAQLAAGLSGASAANRHLVDAGASLLAVAFLIKAAAWPLNFWLVPAYSAATAPVAALFAVLTKVGVYALVRLWTLMFAGGPLAGFGAGALLACGLTTAALAAMGMLASHRFAAQVSFGVIVSAGMLVAALGLGSELALAGAIFYLVASALASSASFMLVDLIERWQAGGTIVEEAPYLTATLEANEVNLDDEQAPLIGRPFPASTALLGMAYLGCALLIAGLPPQPTFIGKLAMLSATLGPLQEPGVFAARDKAFVAVLLGCGLVMLIALTRTGIRTFWSGTQREPPRVRAEEGVPVVLLLLLCGVLTVTAGPAMEIARTAAHSLYQHGPYIEAARKSNATSRVPVAETAR